MVSDVMASVPFHLGFNNSRSDDPPALGGLLLIWNLYKAGSADMAAGHQRDWAIRRLHHIGQTMGIQLAHALALALVDVDEDEGVRSGGNQLPHYMTALPIE